MSCLLEHSKIQFQQIDHNYENIKRETIQDCNMPTCEQSLLQSSSILPTKARTSPEIKMVTENTDQRIDVKEIPFQFPLWNIQSGFFSS